MVAPDQINAQEPAEQEMVSVVIAYDRDLSKIGTTQQVSAEEARLLIREGRARIDDGTYDERTHDDVAAENAAMDAQAPTQATASGGAAKRVRASARQTTATQLPQGVPLGGTVDQPGRSSITAQATPQV